MLFTYRHYGSAKGSYWVNGGRIAEMDPTEAREFENWRRNFVNWVHPMSKNIEMDEKYAIREELSKAMAGKLADSGHLPHLDSTSSAILRSFGMYGKANHYVRT